MDRKYKYINIAQLDAIAGNDLTFKKEIIDIFFEQTNEFILNMLRFLNENNWEMLAKEAHTAKSSVLIFGMKETGGLLKKIQKECQANNLDNVSQMTAEAVSQIKLVIPELKQLRETL